MTLRRFMSVCAFSLVLLGGCASTKRAPVALTSRSEINGEVRTTVAIRVGDAPDVQIVRVLARGKGTLVASTDAPHVVADGDLVVIEETTMPAGYVVAHSKASLGVAATTPALPGGPPVTATDPAAAPHCDATGCHPPPPPMVVGFLKCGGGVCVPGKDPAFWTSPQCVDDRALMLDSPLRERPCGTPIYFGCDGTPGGHAPAPGGTYKTIAPGTGWPCKADTAALTASPVAKAAMLPIGIIGCIVKGLTSTIECMVAGGGL